MGAFSVIMKSFAKISCKHEIKLAGNRSMLRTSSLETGFKSSNPIKLVAGGDRRSTG